jgi:phenylalanyl-tRNA synthetase beta subunit
MNKIKIFEIGTVFKKNKEKMHVAYGDKKGIKEMKLEEFLPSPSQGEGPGVRSIHPGASATPEEGNKFKPWSLFPFIARDIAVWVPEEIKSEDVAEIIKENMGDIVIRGPELFDEFKKGDQISYAFRLVFQSYDRTLTDQEVNDIMTKITNKIKEKNGWQVR